MSTAQYEFSEEHGRLFGDLASTMRMAGALAVGLGALVGAIGVFQLLSSFLFAGIADLAQGLVFFLTGIWVRDAGKAFRLVADTRGKDVSNLMDAVITLRRVFGLQRILLAGALVFCAAVAILLMVAAPGSGR